MKCDETAPQGDKLRQKATQSGRNRLRETAIASLLQEPTLEQAAAKTGVSARTLQRWLADPDFADDFQKTKAISLDRAMAKLSGITWEAVEVLSQIMRDADASPSSRVSASRAVLDMSQRDREVSEVERRISRLEEQANGK